MREYHTQESTKQVVTHGQESSFCPTIGHAILGPRDSWIFCMLATSCSNLRPQAEPITWGGKPFANYSFIYCSYIMNTQRKKKKNIWGVTMLKYCWSRVFVCILGGVTTQIRHQNMHFCVFLIWCFRWVRILSHWFPTFLDDCLIVWTWGLQHEYIHKSSLGESWAGPPPFKWKLLGNVQWLVGARLLL